MEMEITFLAFLSFHQIQYLLTFRSSWYGLQLIVQNEHFIYTITVQISTAIEKKTQTKNTPNKMYLFGHGQKVLFATPWTSVGHP